MESLLNTPMMETPAEVLSCEYCKTFKNNYFEEHLRKDTFDQSRNVFEISNTWILGPAA